ncbi:MAG: hypothetical protein ABIV39_12265 [Verrucomicrobiota bacterium]
MASDYVGARGDAKARLAILEILEDFQAKIYFEAFPRSAVKSDADGKFTLTVSDLQLKIIACRSQREVLDKTENYFWAFKFQPTGEAEQIMFCNDNLIENHNILKKGTKSFFTEVNRLTEMQRAEEDALNQRKLEYAQKLAALQQKRQNEKVA